MTGTANNDRGIVRKHNRILALTTNSKVNHIDINR